MIERDQTTDAMENIHLYLSHISELMGNLTQHMDKLQATVESYNQRMTNVEQTLKDANIIR